MDGPSAFLATCILLFPATSSRRWAARSRDIPSFHECWRGEKPKLRRLRINRRLNEELRAVVEDVIRLTPTIVEIVVRAPIAARAFQPGQFYRLQNYESLAARTNDTVLAMEGLALTGA